MPVRFDAKGKKRWTRVVYVIDLTPDSCEDRKAPCGGNCHPRPVDLGSRRSSQPT